MGWTGRAPLTVGRSSVPKANSLALVEPRTLLPSTEARNGVG